MKLKRLHDSVLRSAVPRATLLAIVNIVLLYTIFAGLWILLSDNLVVWLFSDADSIRIANTLKGLFFVAVTAVLLFILVLRFAVNHSGGSTAAEKVGAGDTAPKNGRHLLYGSSAVLLVVFALLGTGGVLKSWESHRQVAGEQLLSIAQLKVVQLESWLAERRGDSLVASSSSLINEEIQAWRRHRSPAARQRLLTRLESFRSTYQYLSAMLCDAQGNILLQTGPTEHDTSQVLAATVQRALATGKPQMSDFYRMERPLPEHIHLDFVAPLESAGLRQQDGVAVVLRADVVAAIFPYLQTWPVPSNSAETLLFRKDGSDTLFLNELRHETNTTLRKRIPLSTPQLLEAQALTPGYRPGDLLEGIDYRGIPAFGVAQQVGGTPWWLLAKVDREEVTLAARHDVLWIGFSSLLTWFVAVALAMMFFLRRELHHTRQQHQEQAERLRTLQLLDAVVGSSTDVIFAKDTEGCYLLFNNEAARVTGKTSAEVLGKDDRAVFPPAQAERLMANDREVMANGQVTTFQEKLDTTNGEVVFLATKGPLRDADGRIFGLFGISRNITLLKENEETLRQQTSELVARNAELDRFNRAMVGRELDMVALKRQVNALARELDREPPFALDFLDQQPNKAGS